MPSAKISTAGLLELYNDLYDGEAFVRVLPEGQFPSTAFVRGSNFCDIGLKVDGRTGRIIVVTAIDNLVKGASGQAVQNMNIMSGLPENMGLELLALYP
jgi:N-acetyl-gamma-glutamyl-phosphate reductase